MTTSKQFGVNKQKELEVPSHERGAMKRRKLNVEKISTKFTKFGLT
jgi:hypothetical protein